MATTLWTVDGWTGYSGPPTPDEQGVEWVVNDSQGWHGSTDVRTVDDDRPRADGGLDGESFRRPRLVTITGSLKAPDGPSFVDAKERLASLMSDGTALYPLQVTEEGVTRQVMARLAEDVEIRKISQLFARFSITVRAPDHRKYGDESILQTGLPEAVQGLAMPMVMDDLVGVTFQAGGEDGSLLAVNAGRAVTHPLLEFVGPVTDPRVQSATTGRTLAFDIDLGVGQVLAIDCAAGTVLLDGATDMRVALTPASGFIESFTLLPGSNSLLFRAGSSPGGALFRLTYRPAWL